MSEAANRLRGLAAIYEMLDLIGAPEATDKTVAKVLVDNELEIRAMISAIRIVDMTGDEG